MIVWFAGKKITTKEAIESIRIAQEEGRYKLDFILEAHNALENMEKEEKQ